MKLSALPPSSVGSTKESRPPSTNSTPPWKRLTAYGMIFVMITAIAGIYGMNFKFMP